jgi:NAD(P)-dependent dehydrogenase (short-subunit alcohol dehydrogenase family)
MGLGTSSLLKRVKKMTSLTHTQKLHDQIALVSGASRGIGQGIALALAREGALVIGTLKRAQTISLKHLKKKIGKVAGWF